MVALGNRLQRSRIPLLSSVIGRSILRIRTLGAAASAVEFRSNKTSNREELSLLVE